VVRCSREVQARTACKKPENMGPMAEAVCENVSERGRLISQNDTNMEQTGSFGQFLWFVPTANYILNGGVESSLSETDEEADCDETVESVAGDENHGEHAPDEFHGGDLHRETDPGDEETVTVCERGNEGKTKNHQQTLRESGQERIRKSKR